MAQHKIRRSNYDANRVTPNDLLPQLIVEVMDAHSDSKVSYLRKEMLSKFLSEETDPASVRKQRAIEKWLAVEEDNEITNCRLHQTPGDYHLLPRVRFDRFVSSVRALISDVIGEVPTLERFSFSGGATTSRKRLSSHPAEKYVGRADITADAMIVWESICEDGSWSKDANRSWAPTIVPGNVMFTVAKNANIDRVACKEPDLNMYMQKAVGEHFRSRLRLFGINLNDQSRNRRLARQGSLTGDLATLDLSSASDCVTVGLCELLLPDLWFSHLMMLRSPTTLVGDTLHVNAMMSSMGNGFTFELESLLFWAISKVVCRIGRHRGVVSVFGDDIIVPSTGFEDLVTVLRYFGFKPNVAKSFATGPFRESCGGHYINGCDVTPFYVKGPIRKLTDIIHLGNQIRKWSNNESGILDPTFEALWLRIRDLVPEQFWGGADLGDKGALVTPHAPRRRLVPIVAPKQISDDAMYFISIDGSSSEPSNGTRVQPHAIVHWAKTRVIPSKPTIDTNRYRSCRNKCYRFQGPIFMSELG